MRRLPPSGSTSFASGLNSTGVPAVVVMKSSVATGSPPAAPAVALTTSAMAAAARSARAWPFLLRSVIAPPSSPFTCVLSRPWPQTLGTVSR